ncbi:lecithin retinol acyltransferase family protein [Bacillus sp. Marseille-P3661]|uniref:lecithin retinol acyltransferase family protein n=1 Tax=Bacillus sp. Marseille-P3661 TaxID=1936234 RepID=UPI000C85BF98|nr:lecithin retinol acyltransferase family protein [Bacillus sp. Marseille-P3661]
MIPNFDILSIEIRKGNHYCPLIRDKLGDTLEDIGDKADAALGTGDYKYATAEQRKKALTSSMKKTTNRSKTKVEYGDVIGISRMGGLYEHYGVYVGNNRVIHFTSMDSDTSNDNEIMETDMAHFLKDQTSFFILDFEEMIYGDDDQPTKVPVSSEFAPPTPKIPDKYLMKLYSPSETVQRAKSKIGCNGYNLAFNNCEHFAIWCKTGLHKSYQVEGAVSGSKGHKIVVR